MGLVHRAVWARRVSDTSDPTENRQRMAADAENLVAATVTVTPGFSRDLQSTAVTLTAFPQETDFADTLAATAMSANEKRSLSLADNERSKSGWRDLNPRPPTPQAGALARLRYSPSTKPNGQEASLSTLSMAGGVIAVGVLKYKHDNVRERACHCDRPGVNSSGIDVLESWRAWD